MSRIWKAKKTVFSLKTFGRLLRDGRKCSPTVGGVSRPPGFYGSRGTRAGRGELGRDGRDVTTGFALLLLSSSFVLFLTSVVVDCLLMELGLA